MGLTPFACIPVPECVRIVYPDGYVESVTRSCSVSEVLLGNSEYYVCPDKPYNIANRLACDEQLENGVTYFICGAADAQPFVDHHQHRKPSASSRMLPRFSKHHWVQGRGTPTHTTTTASRTRVFDFHSATIQQQQQQEHDQELKSMDHHNDDGDRPPKHLLRLVFIRHCLHALRLPRTSLEQFIGVDTGAATTTSPPPAIDDADLLPILKSAARCELGLYVSRRQEFDLRRARRRRKVTWKPVLQSISETSPIVHFQPPVQASDDSKRFSPPRPYSAVRRKNISPPRQQVFASATKDVSPPPPSPPPQQQEVLLKVSNASSQQQLRNRNTNGGRNNSRSLYMA